MELTFSFLKRFNLPLILPAVLLTVFGLLSIYSSSLGEGDFLNFKKQAVFFFSAFLLLIFLGISDLRFLRVNSYIVFGLYLFFLLLLLFLLFLGVEIRGVKGWYRLGSVSFDPVPFSAIFLIIVLSKYFATRHTETKRFQPILFSGIYAALPIGLVLLQPDLGSSVILLSVWLGIIIFSGIELRHFLILSLVFLILLGLAWQFWLKDYQKQRVLTFLNPGVDKQSSAWNLHQSKIAIGSGGLLGKGLGKGPQTQYGFLPEPQTDFIFSSLAEETGFFGVFILVFLLFFLFQQIIKVILASTDNFTRLFAAGFAFLFLSQSFINIGMNLGLLPIVGIPLPFVSYGGSNLLAFYLGLGVLLSLIRKA